MSLLAPVSFLLGLLLLVAGAEMLVRGASRLAARLGITPLVIGLTVVAFGTSAPELAVSLGAGLTGQADIALGNVVGSNIANVLLVLGLSAVVTPLLVSRRLARVEAPLLAAISVLLLLMSLDGRVDALDGLLLSAGVLLYTALAVRQGRRADTPAQPQCGNEVGPGGRRIALQLLFIVGGLVMLVLGARWLVDAAVEMARWLGVSELVIGLTVVAIGTSAPEAATSVVAALRGERDIAVGNLVGSCLFNLLAVTGLAAMLTPGGLAVAPDLLRFDMPVMLAATFACLAIFAVGHDVTRGAGALLLIGYGAYLLCLFLAASGHAWLPANNALLAGVSVPLAAAAAACLWGRQRRPVTAGS